MRNTVNLRRFLFMRFVHMSAYSCHVTLQNIGRQHGHGAWSPHHHHWCLLRLDHKMFVVLSESAKRKRISLTRYCSNFIYDRSISSRLLHRVRNRLVLRHHNSILMLFDYVIVNPHNYIRLIRHDL